MNGDLNEYGCEYTADEVLSARETRAELIDALITQYHKALLVLRVNYPGVKKTNALTVQMVEDMVGVMKESLGDLVVEHVYRCDAEGPTAYFVIAEEPQVLKSLTIRIEEQHPLGRCLDLDVYDLWGRSLSRQALGYPRRKCYLCENEAHLCVRTRRHSEAEIIASIQEKYRVYKESIHELR